MKTTLQPGRVLFAAAMIALGITGLVNGDFALVWQSVPPRLPARTAVAYAFGVIELATGIGLMFESTLTPACRVLFPYMVLWVVLLEIPDVVRSPLDAGAWAASRKSARCWLARGACSPRTAAVGKHGTSASPSDLPVSVPRVAAGADAADARGRSDRGCSRSRRPRHATMVADVAAPAACDAGVMRGTPIVASAGKTRPSCLGKK